MTGRSWLGASPQTTRRAIAGLSAALLLLLSGTAGLQDAAANGDTRTLDLYHEHTKESASITFRRNGQYSSEGLRQLNWMLRDWRIDEQVQMDPKLFDIVWQVYREARATGSIHVNSAYRSPQTNAALRRRSRGVAEFSQHMRGKAMDFFLEGTSMARVREIGVRLQHGGVGFYPHSRNQFVHLDAGGVRSWPRLPDAQLARLFPDGRTVHIPKSGRPLGGYEEAKASILARGGTVAGFSTYAEGGPRKSLWATLFGGGEDEDEDMAMSGGRSSTRVASAGTNDQDGGVRGFFSFLSGGRSAPVAPPTPAPEPEPEPVRLPPPGEPGPAATATPAPVEAATIHVPLPPRRPTDIAGPAAKDVQPTKDAHSAKAAPAARLASGGPVTLPPTKAAPPDRRGETRAPSRAVAGRAVAGIGSDDRAAVKSLFEGAATAPRKKPGETPASERRVRTSFSSGAASPLTTGSFSKPPLTRAAPKR